MKDLFVELTQLNASLGTVAAITVALRTDMLDAAGREADLELSLADELLKLSDAARQLATEIRGRKVGVSFTNEELDTPATATKRHARKRRKGPGA